MSMSVFVQLFLIILVPNCISRVIALYSHNNIMKTGVEGADDSVHESKHLKFQASAGLKDTKYILQWSPSKIPFSYLGEGSRAFEQNRCRYRNCFVTDNRTMLSDLRHFDAVAFHGKDLTSLHTSFLPTLRSQKQKYIFATMESPHYYPICDPFYDGYFNWTWTYRLDSDVRWSYFRVYDLHGDAVAPEHDVTWPPLQHINYDFRIKLRDKKEAAVWLVSNCVTKSRREKFVDKVSDELKKYNMTIDVFGLCSISSKCYDRTKECYRMIQKKYYFLFAFENSFDKDYVSEKPLTALNNFTVPVVYGGANYSRFLPPGSYLDGRALGAEVLARTMRDIIHNRSRYEDMFRWRTYYKFKDTSASDVCNLCAKLNDAEEMSRETVRQEFRAWWNTDASWCDAWHRPPPPNTTLAPLTSPTLRRNLNNIKVTRKPYRRIIPTTEPPTEEEYTGMYTKFVPNKLYDEYTSRPPDLHLTSPLTLHPPKTSHSTFTKQEFKKPAVRNMFQFIVKSSNTPYLTSPLTLIPRIGTDSSYTSQYINLTELFIFANTNTSSYYKSLSQQQQLLLAKDSESEASSCTSHSYLYWVLNAMILSLYL